MLSMPRLRILVALAVASGVSALALADTRTSFPAGTPVQVTTTTGVVAGVLQDSPEPDWIRLVEPGL
jgi:hypothetical protein